MPDLALALVAIACLAACYLAMRELADLAALALSAQMERRATERAVARAMRRDPAIRTAVLEAARLAGLDTSCPF